MGRWGKNSLSALPVCPLADELTMEEMTMDETTGWGWARKMACPLVSLPACQLTKNT